MVPRFEITNISSDELRIDILPRVTRKAFLGCTALDFLPCSDWYLAGGTALALQVGHRQSIDLDFFTTKGDFRGYELERQFFNTKKWATKFQEGGTLYGEFMNAKMSFMAYPFFKPSAFRIQCGSICILKAEDIVAMKIIAISQRGRKRDFLDLYWYSLNREPLIDVIRRAIKQYPGQEDNFPHILKSLVYFKDAEKDPMPEVFFKANWKTIKSYFLREVPKAARELLKL